MNEKKNDDITIHAEDSLDIFAKFDQLDDQLIIDEIEKRVIDVWVYHFTEGGKEIWGLAKAGIDECSILMGKKGIALREDKVWFEDDPKSPEHVIFFARVNKFLVDKQGREAQVDSAIGTKRQHIMRKIKQADGYRMVTNQFWAEQGSIKALRNAKMRLIPEEIKAKVIANAKNMKKVRDLKSEKEQESKKQTKAAPKKQEPVETQEPEGPPVKLFPDDETEMEQGRPASQSQKTKVTGLMQTMVDKYGFTPDVVLQKMEAKAGSYEIAEYTDIQAQAVIEYFEWAIKEIEKKK